MQYLDHVKLQAVLDGFTKRAFVPMPGGAAEPVAGASPMTAGMAAPMGGDPAAAGGMPPVDPATGMPMDPAMAGGAPMDPAMAGGMPMDPAAMGGEMPMDPAMMDMDPAMMGGGAMPGTVTMSIPELIQLIEVVKGGGGGASKPGADTAMGGEEGGVPGEAKPKKAGGTAAVNEKLDTLLAALGLGAGAAPTAMGGTPPPPMPGM